MKLIDADEFKHKQVDSFDTYHGEDCAKFFSVSAHLQQNAIIRSRTRYARHRGISLTYA